MATMPAKPRPTLIELARAAERMANNLAEVHRRTPEQRAALARECADLLRVLARRIHPHDDSRSQRIGDLQSVYLSWAIRECDAVRLVALQRACQFASVDPGPIDRISAHRSDAALEEFLARLQQGQRPSTDDR